MSFESPDTCKGLRGTTINVKQRLLPAPLDDFYRHSAYSITKPAGYNKSNVCQEPIKELRTEFWKSRKNGVGSFGTRSTDFLPVLAPVDCSSDLLPSVLVGRWYTPVCFVSSPDFQKQVRDQQLTSEDQDLALYFIYFLNLDYRGSLTPACLQELGFYFVRNPQDVTIVVDPPQVVVVRSSSNPPAVNLGPPFPIRPQQRQTCGPPVWSPPQTRFKKTRRGNKKKFVKSFPHTQPVLCGVPRLPGNFPPPLRTTQTNTGNDC